MLHTGRKGTAPLRQSSNLYLVPQTTGIFVYTSISFSLSRLPNMAESNFFMFIDFLFDIPAVIGAMRTVAMFIRTKSFISSSPLRNRSRAYGFDHHFFEASKHYSQISLHPGLGLNPPRCLFCTNHSTTSAALRLVLSCLPISSSHSIAYD